MHPLAWLVALLVVGVGQGVPRLTVDGPRLVTETGTVFEWRGVTAFRLVDHVADGRERDAVAYLDWARATGFTIVRVLSRIDGWADLSPADGQRHLPRVLSLAAERGLYVQVVATVGSGSTPYDWRAHARRIAHLCAAASNCLYEFANEPGHPSQASELHDMAAVDRAAADAVADLRRLLWTAGASWSSHRERHPGGRFLVRHLERSGSPMEQVSRLPDLAALSRASSLFVVSNEPLGADERDGRETGRQRSNDPRVFDAMGAHCRRLAIGCTFHLQDGLATTLPRKVQRAAAAAFIAGWRR